MKITDLDFNKESHYKTAMIDLYGWKAYVHHEVIKDNYQLNWLIENECLTAYSLSKEELNALLSLTEIQLIMAMHKM